MQNYHMSGKEKTPIDIKQFFIPILVVVAIGLAFFSGTLWQKVRNVGVDKNTKTGEEATAETTSVSLDTIKGLFDKDLVKFGDANDEVIFVEMSDPSCPYCSIADGHNPELSASAGDRFTYLSEGGSYVPPGTEIEKLVAEGKASYIFIYYPGHGNGEMGTKALYCAYEQGKFWEARKLITSSAGYSLWNETVKNDSTKSDVVAEFLKSVTDYNTMKSCLDSGKYDERLEADSQIAVELGIQGTPNFYVNDTNFMGAYSYSDMESIVDAALK